MVGTKGSLVLQLSDNVGNKCIEGDAPLEIDLHTNEVLATYIDQQDGTYLLSWQGEVAGTFSMSITVGGMHIRGSPTQLTMLAAELEVSKCEFVAEKAAVAGVAETIQLVCRDPFGNDAGTLLELRFGLVLLALPSNEKAPRDNSKPKGAPGASEVDGEKKSYSSKKEERANLIKTMASFDVGSTGTPTHTLHPCSICGLQPHPLLTLRIPLKDKRPKPPQATPSRCGAIGRKDPGAVHGHGHGSSGHWATGRCVRRARRLVGPLSRPQQSEAIRGSQWHSTRCSGTLTMAVSMLQSEAIGGNQKPSGAAIRSHQEQSP